MQAGKLNKRVTIQQLVSGQDAIGQPVQTWSDVASVWASIIHKNGLQALKSDADVSLVQASIRLRYRTGITAGMRILYGSIAYDIKAVLPDEEKRVNLDLICERVA